MNDIKQIYSKFTRSEGVTTDSRVVNNGMIFFAIKGEKFNGNRFALKAIEQGADYAIVDDPAVAGSHQKFIHVEDALKTLQQLANYHRKQLRAPVIAITGSNGKTTTKELLSITIRKKFKIYATPGNLNNHIGLPLSILQVTREDEYVILEFGANHPGENAFLANIAEPDMGLITNIGKDHLEGFGSPEGVKNANAELFDYLEKNNGKAFVNYDDPAVLEIGKKLKHKGYGKYLTNGPEYAGKIASSEFYLKVRIANEPNIANRDLTIFTHLVGGFHFSNVMCAYAVSRELGISAAQVKNAIESYIPDNNRTQVIKTAYNTIIMDAYNANPSSMELIVKEFAWKGNMQSKMLILGDMNELGKYAEKEHKIISEWIGKNFSGDVLLVGKEFGKCAGLIKNARHFSTTDELIEYLAKYKLSEKHILIKGSRSFELERAKKYL